MFTRKAMNARSFADLLAPLALLVLVGGWVLAVVAFFVVGTETCSTVEVPIAGVVEACQDTTPSAVILLTVIGFGATVGSLFLWALRHMLLALNQIEENTRSGR
jgi:hypothetical protein